MVSIQNINNGTKRTYLLSNINTSKILILVEYHKDGENPYIPKSVIWSLTS